MDTPDICRLDTVRIVIECRSRAQRDTILALFIDAGHLGDADVLAVACEQGAEVIYTVPSFKCAPRRARR